MEVPADTGITTSAAERFSAAKAAGTNSNEARESAHILRALPMT